MRTEKVRKSGLLRFLLLGKRSFNTVRLPYLFSAFYDLECFDKHLRSLCPREFVMYESLALNDTHRAEVRARLRRLRFPFAVK